MNYSYTQLSQYLACPRRYRYRYLEGWQEKDIRANLVFGRAFENALGSYFRREDASVTFFEQWSQYRDADLEYSFRRQLGQASAGRIQTVGSIRARRSCAHSSTSQEPANQTDKADLSQQCVCFLS